MKKLILLFLITFLIQCLNAQDFKYRVVIDDMHFRLNGPDNFNPNPNQSIIDYRIYVTNSSSPYYVYSRNYWQGVHTPFNSPHISDSITFTNQKPYVVQLFFNLERRKIFSVFPFYNNYTMTDTKNTPPFDNCYADPTFYYFYEDLEFFCNLKISPIVKLQQPVGDHIIALDTPINIATTQDTSGLDPSLYNWEYQVVTSGNNLSSTNWLPMPAFTQGQTNFTIVPNSFLSNSALNKKIYFRVKTCDGNVSDDLVFYDIRKISPEVTSVTTVASECYDGTGKAVFHFNRALDPGESITIGLTVDPNLSLMLPSVPVITSLDANNSYEIDLLPPATYTYNFIGFYNGLNTYTGGINQTGTFTIVKPSPVEFTTTGTNVYCKGGNDGEIEINASGGTVPGNYGGFQFGYADASGNVANWINFNTPTSHTLTGLSPGTYQIMVRDGNHCVAKEIVYNSSGQIQGLGAELIQTIEITEPDTAVDLQYTYSENPTGNGFNDGTITALVTGGTPYTDGSYDYVWTDSAGTVLTNITETIGNDEFYLTLNNVAAGTYYLTVTDMNYNDATDKPGCTIAELPFELIEPAPIAITLSITQEISCNVANQYGDETDLDPADGQRDESEDGIIQASVTGGTPFATGLPYIYTWKKFNNATQTWDVLSGQTTNTISKLAGGEYALNVEDANGVIVGQYSGTQLISATDETIVLPYPPQLSVQLSSTPATCANGSTGANGAISATVQGGIPPYTYYWSTGDTGNNNQIANLLPNNYFVQVVDAKGCMAEANVEVTGPPDFSTQVIQKANPTCFNSNDGFIDIDVVGGDAPFTYLWNNGATTQDISGVTAGNYNVVITDSGGCIINSNFILENPQDLSVDLGEDVTLCINQSFTIDGTSNQNNCTYQWTSNNGFSATDPIIEVSQAGVYTLTVTNSAGCQVQDQIEIFYSNTPIDAAFLLSTQAYVDEEVIFVNVSSPQGETTTWLVPSGAQIIQENDNFISLRFSQTGSYQVGIQSTQGQCVQDFYKTIIVEEDSGLPSPGDTDNPFIINFDLTPNPNNGSFQIFVELAEESPISVRIFDYAGAMVTNPRNESGDSIYTLNYNLSLGSGTYLVILETAQKTVVKRMIVF